MKKLLIIVTILFTVSAQSQTLNPVSWTFSAKKITVKTYELHLTASMQTGWHLYSQTQPDDAIAIPTGFTFTTNPLLILNGSIKEIGKLEKFHDAKLQLSANQYSEKVDFVQLVKLKSNIRTNVAGSVEYQTCDDKKCLPPKTVNFSVALK